MPRDVVYLNIESVIAINEAYSEQGVHDYTMLNSAVNQPRQEVFGVELYPSLSEKAAVLFRGIARNHAFVDGNKRCALMSLGAFLGMNNKGIPARSDELVELTVGVATGTIDVGETARWINARMCPLIRLRHPSVTEMERALYRLGQL